MTPIGSIFQDAFFILVPILALAAIPFMGPSLARMSGWAKLAEAYSTLREYDGFKLQGRRGRFGKWTGYNGILTLGADSEGFYLSVIRFFKSGHPPLFFPWKDIKAREERAWMKDWVVLEFTQCSGVTFALYKSDVLKLNERGGSFPIALE
jgi:hypothetical protein